MVQIDYQHKSNSLQPVFGEKGKVGEIYDTIAIQVCRWRARRIKPLCCHYSKVTKINGTISQQVCRIVAEIE